MAPKWQQQKGVRELYCLGHPDLEAALQANGITYVSERKQRVFVEHSRPGITHYGDDSRIAVITETIGGAPAAHRLMRSIAAGGNTLGGVFQKLPAITAHPINWPMEPVAINCDHF